MPASADFFQSSSADKDITMLPLIAVRHDDSDDGRTEPAAYFMFIVQKVYVR
eukprot:SAG22_NODE_6920_length_795_cov_0.938218_1_plen_51_part_10